MHNSVNEFQVFSCILAPHLNNEKSTPILIADAAHTQSYIALSVAEFSASRGISDSKMNKNMLLLRPKQYLPRTYAPV